MTSVSFSRQRILSLWLCRFSTDRLVRQGLLDGIAPGTPLVVAAKDGNVERLIAVDAAAETRGLRTGLALAEARAMHPDLMACPHDAAADACLLDDFAERCLRYTPLIATDPPDGLLLDIGGCAHLFGGEERLAADLAARLTRIGFAHRIAVADTIGAAWAVARFGDAAVQPSGAQRESLLPLPLAALRLPGEIVASLGRVGLKRVGDIIDLPRAPLAARFGATLLRQLDRALDREHEPLMPRLPVAPYVVEQRFAEPILREEDVLAAVDRLAGRLRAALERRHAGARHIELALFRTDGAVRRIAAGTSRPLRDPTAIRALFVERLAGLADPLDPGFGFDLARLSVLIADAAPPEQIGIAGHDDSAALDQLVDRLSARLGRHRVTRLVAQDSHIPELAVAALPAQAVPDGWDTFGFGQPVDIGARPLRLLVKPEPIDALATAPDGPPFRFHWRRALHEVVAAEGPERIAGTWWCDDDMPRDYFRVEDKTGLRFWLFRLGLYHETPTPRWFLHGLFA